MTVALIIVIAIVVLLIAVVGWGSGRPGFRRSAGSRTWFSPWGQADRVRSAVISDSGGMGDRCRRGGGVMSSSWACSSTMR